MNGLVASKVSPPAGKPDPVKLLVNVSKLIAAFYAEVPDASVPQQRFAFGTTGHRGSAFAKSFNEAHVLAISQAICHSRRKQHIASDIPQQKGILGRLSPQQIRSTELGEGKIAERSHARARQRRADWRVQGDDGKRVVRGTAVGYGRHAESFRAEHHVRLIVDKAQAIVGDAFSTAGA